MKTFLVIILSLCSINLHAKTIRLNESVKIQTVFSTPKKFIFFPIRDASLDKKIKKLLKAARPGSTVHTTIFKSNNAKMAQHFVDAQNRGVNVYMIMSETQREKPYLAFSKVIDKGMPKENVTYCLDGGCQGVGSNHNKFYLFNDTKKGKNIVIQSSANLSKSHNYRFNDMMVIYGDVKLYDSYLRYWQDMAKQEKVPDYQESPNGIGQSDTGNTIKTWWSPTNNLKNDPFFWTLGKTRCLKGAGHSILVSHSYYKQKRALKNLKQLLRLKEEGCQVKMVLRSDDDHNHLKEELKVAEEKGIKVHLTHPLANSFIDVHSKMILIDAITEVDGETAKEKIVIAGSSNMKDGSLIKNDETILRVINNKVHRQYKKYFKKMWKLK